MEGGKDGKVKRNYEAALTYLEQIDKQGEINVEKLIKECLGHMDLAREEQVAPGGSV